MDAPRLSAFAAMCGKVDVKSALRPPSARCHCCCCVIVFEGCACACEKRSLPADGTDFSSQHNTRARLNTTTQSRSLSLSHRAHKRGRTLLRQEDGLDVASAKGLPTRGALSVPGPQVFINAGRAEQVVTLCDDAVFDVLLEPIPHNNTYAPLHNLHNPPHDQPVTPVSASHQHHTLKALYSHDTRCT